VLQVCCRCVASVLQVCCRVCKCVTGVMSMLQGVIVRYWRDIVAGVLQVCCRFVAGVLRGV